MMRNDQAKKLRELVGSSTPSFHSTTSHTIAIVSGKGGVGKTNFTVNFAISLAREGKRVLIFDMDLGMGNVHLLLGASPSFHMMDYIYEKQPLAEVIETYGSLISFISGGSQLEEIVHWSPLMVERLFEAFQQLEKEYDYILFDMGAGVTERSLDIIESVDDVIVIATEEPTSITDAYSMMKFLTLRNMSTNISIVSNRVENRKHPDDVAKRLQYAMSRFLNKEILILGYIEEDPIVRESVIARVPYVQYNPHSTASLNMRRIVARFLGKKDVDVSEKQSFLDKMKRWLKRG